MALAGGAGRALTTMLTNELAAREGFAVVERQKLYAVLAEQDLAASGRVSPDQGATIGRLVGADYLVTGTVTALEETTREPAKRSRRWQPQPTEVYIAVDLRVIDVASASIAFARTVEGFAEREDDGGGGMMGEMYTQGDPQVVRAAVIEIIDYLECEMVLRDAQCRAAYAAKDAARVQRARSMLKDGGSR
jgi:curli biogenesis system outer membrane secretion channel CsgG